jgi:hypothetical protein
MESAMPEREHWVPHHLEGGLEEGTVKVPSQQYRDNFDRIFGPKTEKPEVVEVSPSSYGRHFTPLVDGRTPVASPEYRENFDRVFGSVDVAAPAAAVFHVMTARDGTEVRLLCVDDCPVCHGNR